MTYGLELDAETRSDVDLKRCGSYVYFASTNTDCLMISYHLNGKKGRWRRGQPCPPEIVAHIEAGGAMPLHRRSCRCHGPPPCPGRSRRGVGA